ncbi:MAG: BatA domain-containing protein [Deltaproteobacteria bacterium]|nr:BatA domain-containing protein [Deltaproteobacteria bacterium]MCB9787170.1 BatA domain-containing protein [Deltaproteobacteria bacterium]
MRFDNPWMLLGTLAAAIPVIIHLINRHRARVRPFAAVEFLLLSDKRLARRLRVRQLLVLALRVLLMLAIPFALAKPYLQDEPAPGVDLAEPGAVVLIVDDSLSMQAVPEAGADSLLQRAVARAQEAVEAGGARTSFAVVAAGLPARLLTPGLTYDRTTLTRALERVVPSARGGDMAGALREAERVLAESHERRRRVIVLSDQAAHAWAGISEPWALADPPAVDLVDVGLPDAPPPPNASVAGVAVRPAPEVGPGQVHVDVTVANHGATERDLPVTVDLAGVVATSSATLPAGRRDHVTSVLGLPGPASGLRGSARLPPDALAADDTWYFTVDFGGEVTVGVVNGSPRNVPYLDELFFVRAALEAPTGDVARIHPIWLTPDDLEPGRIEPLDALILANVGRLTRPQEIAVETFVEQGGGLLVTAGDQLTPESSLSYGPLLPLPIRATKQVGKPGDPATELSLLRFDDLDSEHPVMREFAEVDEVSLLKARTWSYALLDAAQREGVRVLASFTGGQPALVEAPFGRGRLMMLTTTVDRDGSDLCIRSSFLPLLHQLTLYLAGKLDRESGESHRVGEPAIVEIPPGEGALVLERPDGAQVAIPDPAPETKIEVGDIDVVGHYALRRRSGDAAETVFAVNADRAESELARADLVAVAELLRRPGAGVAPPVAEAEDPELSVDAPSSRRTRLWPVVLVALFWLLASEAWLVLRS